MDVCILGTGLDAMLVAHAAVQLGHKPVIYGGDNNEKLSGIRYLQAEIPNLSVPSVEFYASTNPDFTERDYLKKVFGDKDFDHYAGRYHLAELDDDIWFEHYGWDAHKAYDSLNLLYASYIEYQWITPDWYKNTGIRTDFDIVFNTLSMSEWCNGGAHTFACSYSWVTDDGPFGPPESGDVILNSNPEIGWYRQANLFGQWVVEWPEDRRPPLFVEKVVRPLQMTCNCASKVYGFNNVGMMALWDHRVQINESYSTAVDLIEQVVRKPMQLDLEFK